MGSNAKVHKRTRKKEKSSSAIGSMTANHAQASAATVQAAKKRAGLKNKVVSARRNGPRDTPGPVLQGADYVALLPGGRKKAKEEAQKLSNP